MDNQQQVIIETLNQMVRNKSGGKKPLKELFKQELQNPYIDDGSYEFEKLYVGIIKDIANDMTIERLKDVPQKAIDKVMKNLRDEWELQNDSKVEYYEEAEKVNDKLKEAVDDDDRKKRILQLAKAAPNRSDLKKILRKYDNYELIGADVDGNYIKKFNDKSKDQRKVLLGRPLYPSEIRQLADDDTRARKLVQDKDTGVYTITAKGLRRKKAAKKTVKKRK